MSTIARADCVANLPGSDLVKPWQRWERAIKSNEEYLNPNLNPSRDLELSVTFSQVGVGKPVSYTAGGFWYGLDANNQPDGKAFCIRGAFPEGRWRWTLSCKRREGHRAGTYDCSNDSGLNTNGEFVVSGTPEGPLSGGFLKVKPGKSPALIFDNGDNFFWLGDTVWNANIAMDDPANPNSTPDWDELLANRADFSILQMGFAPHSAMNNKNPGQKPFVYVGGTGCTPDQGTEPASDQKVGKCHRFNPVWWRAFDDKVQKANASGLVVVLSGFIDPVTLASDQVQPSATEAKYFAEAITARMLGNFVVFSPGFDHRLGCLKDNIETVGTGIRKVDLWKQKGKPDRSIHLITNHTAGNTKKEDYKTFFHSKSWLNFELFQSGTPVRAAPNTQPDQPCPNAGGPVNELETMTERAMSLPEFLMKQTPVKTAINGESVYPGTSPIETHNPYRARQTAYLSMLSGAQGYTMGVCGVWNWGLSPNYGCDPAWDRDHDGVELTIQSMRVMRSIFQSLPVPWVTLKPKTADRIKENNGTPDKKRVLAWDLKTTFLAYVPSELTNIKISFHGIQGLKGTKNWPEDKWSAIWYDPRTGEHEVAEEPFSDTNGVFLFDKPGDPAPQNCEQAEPVVPCNDWVLRVTKGGVTQSPSGALIQVVNGATPQSQGRWVTAKTVDSITKLAISQQVLNSDGASSPGAPQIATATNGNSMVVWQAGNASNAKVLGRVLNAQGNPVTPEFVIVSGRTAWPGHPAVASVGNDFVVTWAGVDANNYGPWIRTRRYSSQGAPLTAAGFAVACSFADGDAPQIAGDSNGGYVLAWELTDGNGIYVLKVDAMGNKSDARIAENTGSIAVLENLDVFASAITVSYGLYANDGTPAGGNTETVNLQSRTCSVPVLAIDDAFSTETNTPITIAYREFLENDAPGVTFHNADSTCVPAAGGCTYTPPFGFTGNVTFSYTVRDAAGNTGSAVVTIAVNPPLVANPDSFTMEGDGSLPITSTQLLANDTAGAVFVDVLNPVNGTITCAGTNPAICTFTPFSGFRGTASFQYRISRDGNLPATTGNVTITVTPPSQFDVLSRCTDGVCVFTAIAPHATSARNYVWRINGGNSFTSVYKINQRFTASGVYTVSVTVTYANGLLQQQGSTSVNITYAPAPTWRTQVSGLGFNLDQFDLSMFPGTTRIPTINWSSNPADCADPANGCGDLFAGPDTSCFLQNCRLYGSYSHTGIFDATLRIQDGGVVLKEYPVAMEAVNQEPSPSFTVSRPDLNVRSYVFTNINHGDDGPYPVTYAWDFGDGTEDSGGEDKTHPYPTLGTYNATLTVMDGDGLTGSYTVPINVTNALPVPRVTVNCRGLECEFGGELSTDDGSNITTWSWDFGNGQTGSGPRIIHQYLAGCYTVTLTVTDGDGASASTTLKVVAGPPLVSTNTKVVVDAHVQSYSSSSGWQTTNGNLNGILEPGETVVVEPTWPIAPSTQQLPVSAFGAYPWGNEYGFRDTAPWYDISTGFSDCWSLGKCYAVFALPQYAQTRPLHADIQFNETNLANGQPTPGSPVKIHVGKSFSDVPTTHWSYAGIESVLHAGVDTGCGGTQFCPGTIVTRGEVARWLLKAKHGASYQPPACTASPFTDVPCSHPFAAWIAQLKAEGITNGDGSGNYAPDQPLSRAEAAVFLLRTKMGAAYVPPACSPDFGDVACEGHWAAAWISDIKARGISRGCDLTEFCPSDAVDRAQAAALFAKTFDLRIDTLQCPIVTNGGYDLVPTHVDLPPIVGITFNPNPAVVGGVSTATMTIGDPPPVATSIALSIDNPAASVPATVNVPARATSVTFGVTPANITVRTTTHITATYLGYPKTVALDICTQPAAIGVQPVSRIINAGQSTTLSVTASGGGGPLSYQWYQGTAPSTATPVQNATGSSLTVTPSVTTSYWVRVNATCGGVNSATATVTVCYPPQISGVLDDYVVIGSSTTLTANVTGSGPLSYQWYEGTSGNTTNPVGTNATFTTPAITTARSYWLRVTSTCNGSVSVNSPTATITPVTQITRRQVAASTVNSLTSITTNWTRPTQPGSLLVAVMSSSHVGTVGAFGVPAGWQQAAGYEWNNLKTTIYYYPNNPGGRTAETITTASFRESVLQLIEYVGATATPLDVTAFDGDHAPRSGIVSTGTTQWMTQPKAVLVSAFSTNQLTSFTSPTNSFTRLNESSVYESLTAAVHERMVAATANYGHDASSDSTSQWLGVIATFKSINDCTVAPAITAQPAGSTINSGQTASLSVTANGGGLTYQWYQGASGVTTNPIIGANASTLSVNPSATTSYWVRVANSCGVANSSAATVAVCNALGIATQPLSQSVTSGFSATLSVTPSGSGPFTYQWYEGASGTTTTPVSGATAATYTTPALTANKSYWVRVTSTCNGSTSVNSNTATLTVSTASSIARRQLAANSANSQTSITTTWNQPTQAGSLLVAVISAQHGAVVGNLTPPAGWQLATSYEMANLKSAIYYYPNHPGGRTAETFTVAGFRELVLQLIEYTGATTSPLDKVAFNGDMTAGGLVSTGTTTTTAQAKEVVVTALAMMAQTNFTVPTNGFVRLDQRNVYNMLTATVHERIVTTAGAYGHSTDVDASNQWVGLVATFKSLDLCTGPPTIATQPTSPTISSGSTATLSVTAGGTGPFTYQWYEGASGTTTTPVGTNSASFTTPALTATRSYWVRVSNACGNVASNTATVTVTVCTAPGIGTQPAPKTINSGQTATLTVTATGSGPFTYQWYEGASGVTTTPVGTNSASFTTPALTATKTYWVRVTSTCNGSVSVNSSAATVTVCLPPGIATHPASQTIASGASATLSVVASGSGPFTYQWYEGASGTTTTPVGTNSASFTTPALTAAKSYWVRVTSTCNGSATANSNTATISINAVLARRQFATNTANSQLTITTNWTQPTQAGTLLVAIVSAERSFYPIANWQPPAGWQLAVSYEMVNIKTAIYYYPNNPGGRTAETFANGGYYDDMILQLAEYTGVATVAPLDKTAFNGNHTNDGYVETGYTTQTSQPKELVITALTAHATTEFYAPSASFLELDDRNQGFGNLTTAVHERIVTTAGGWGHYAQVLDPGQWVGVVATFKGQ